MKDNMDELNQTENTEIENLDNQVQDENDENKENPQDLEQDNLENEEANEADNQEGQEREKKKKKPVQARIDELTRKQKEAQEEANFWRQEAQNKAKPIEQEIAEPDPLNYDDDNEYKKDLKAFYKQEVQREAQTKTYVSRYEEQGKNIPDFNEVILKANSYGTVSSDTFNKAILESDNSALLAYEIAKDPHNAVRLSKLAISNPVAFGKEVGKIEAKLSSSKSLDLNNIKKTTPKPPTPVSNNEVNTNFMNMPFDEYMRKR